MMFRYNKERLFMQIQEQIIAAIDTTLKNPIYQTIRLLGIKAILKQANFIVIRATYPNSFDRLGYK